MCGGVYRDGLVHGINPGKAHADLPDQRQTFVNFIRAQVGQVEIVSDTTREPGFAECLAGRVRRRWTVPAAPGYQLLLPLGFFD